MNNGLLPVQVSEEFLQAILKKVIDDPKTMFEVDLENQKISVLGDPSLTESFEVNAYKKECLINGFDDIDYLVSLKEEIANYELMNSQ